VKFVTKILFISILLALIGCSKKADDIFCSDEELRVWTMITEDGHYNELAISDSLEFFFDGNTGNSGVILNQARNTEIYKDYVRKYRSAQLNIDRQKVMKDWWNEKSYSNKSIDSFYCQCGSDLKGTLGELDSVYREESVARYF
jgi:hypothetical protein